MYYRIFAYRPGEATPLPGTIQFGDLAISIANDNNPYYDHYGSVDWYCGPDEALRYIVALPNTNVDSNLRFWGSKSDTDESFLDLINRKTKLGYIINVDIAKEWLDSMKYWTNYSEHKYPQIATGMYSSYSLSSFGQVWEWGLQLIYNGFTPQITPISIHGANKTFCHISVGEFHTVAIDHLGKAWGWGYNDYGQLGDNTTTHRNMPVAVCSNKTFCHIETGKLHTTAIDNHGQAWAWGNNDDGQLGDNTITSRRTPVSVFGNKTFCHLKSNFNFSAAIDYQDNVWAWGRNNVGQLGDNTTISRRTPVAICGNKIFHKISMGRLHMLAVDYQGQVWGWGKNDKGQLGDNTVTDRRTPVAICGNKTFCHIAAGELHTMAIDYLGKVWAWGNNFFGQLGINTTLSKRTPVAVCGNKTFCRISTKWGHNLGVDYYDQIWGWGYNVNGELGDNTQTNKCTPVKVHTHIYPLISTRYQTTLYIQNGQSQIWGWGYNEHGEIGNNSLNVTNTPVSIHGACKTFCHISASFYNSYSIDYKGQVWGWGYNFTGEIGDMSTTQRLTPVSVHGQCKTICNISTHEFLSMTIDYKGQIWGWGYNGSGQLGDNTIIDKLTPVSIHGACKTFCHISAGFIKVLAIDYQGQIWAWGNNTFGQLGNNSTLSKKTPVSIHGSKKTYRYIASGWQSSNAIDRKGQIWGWGYNNKGQLGDNTTTSRRTPVSIHGAKKTFCHIAAGQYYTTAIDYKGQIWGWGYNASGQLGDNTTTSRLTPISIHGAKKTFCYISNGHDHTIAIDVHDNVWGWGINFNHQLGDNTTTNRCTPIRVYNL